MADDFQIAAVMASEDRAEDQGAPDGRRLRGARTRNSIIAAYIDVLRGGEHSPRAKQVAERAGVGVRTVYNQFRDLERLRAEVGTVVLTQFTEQALRDVPRAASLEQRVDLLVSKRARFYEELGPYARAVQSHHARSEELRRQQAWLVEPGRRELNLVFGSELARRTGHGRSRLIAALLTVSSWPAWVALRDELELDATEAAVVMKQMLTAQLR